MTNRRHADARTAIIAAITCAVLGLHVVPAASAATAGRACVKVGAVSWQGKTKLRCTKVGARLLWRATVTARPKPGPQVAPDAMLGTACTEPGHEVLNAAGPIRCTDGTWAAIQPAQDSVASRAYRNLMVQYWANPASAVKLRIVSDTDTAFAVGPIERGIRAADRLWSVAGTLQPYPVLIAHNSSTLGSQADALRLQFEDSSRSGLASQEAQYGACSTAEFHTRVLTQPWLSFCMGYGPADESDLGRGFALGAHEYTHLVQFALLDDIKGWRTYISMAPWFSEGLASYVMMALGGVAGDGDLRKVWLPGLDSTTATLADYNKSIPPGGRYPYALGLFATEALYALAGPGIAERVLRAASTGLKFTDAFKKATGHTLEQWTPVLSAYVDSVKARQEMTLAELQDLRARTLGATG